MKKFIVGFLCTIMTVAMVGCGKGGSNQKEITLSEVAHSVFYAPQYVAIEEGYFKEEGIDLKLINSAGADKVMTAILSGEADIGLMGSEASVYVYQEGQKDYVVNFAGLTQRAGNFLVGREAKDNETGKTEKKDGEEQKFDWKNLKGKTILGGRKGGMPEMIFEYILKKKGLVPGKDVTIIQNIDFGLTAPAFASGQGDYTVEFEPYATGLESEGEGVVLSSLGEESGYIPYTAYQVQKSYMETHKDELEGFARAIQKGLDYVNQHSAEEIAKIIKPQFKETEEEKLIRIVERYKEQDTWKKNTRIQEQEFLLLEDILKEAEQIDEFVPYEELVQNIQ